MGPMNVNSLLFTKKYLFVYTKQQKILNLHKSPLARTRFLCLHDIRDMILLNSLHSELTDMYLFSVMMIFKNKPNDSGFCFVFSIRFNDLSAVNDFPHFFSLCCFDVSAIFARICFNSFNIYNRLFGLE